MKISLIIDIKKKLMYNVYMGNNQSSEDYLECILLLSRESEFVHRVDVARRIGVSQPAVQKAVKLLESAGFVECNGMHIYLTEKGEKYALEIFDRHCTLTRFLQKLGVKAKEAEEDACKMEHILSQASFEAIKKFLDE